MSRRIKASGERERRLTYEEKNNDRLYAFTKDAPKVFKKS